MGNDALMSLSEDPLSVRKFKPELNCRAQSLLSEGKDNTLTLKQCAALAKDKCDSKVFAFYIN